MYRCTNRYLNVPIYMCLPIETKRYMCIHIHIHEYAIEKNYTYPLVNKHKHGLSPCSMEKSTINCPCSTVILIYQMAIPMRHTFRGRAGDGRESFAGEPTSPALWRQNEPDETLTSRWPSSAVGAQRLLKKTLGHWG